jgi:hypothetical protein
MQVNMAIYTNKELESRAVEAAAKVEEYTTKTLRFDTCLRFANL